MPPDLDRIDFELFKSALFAAADEMAVTVCRTTYSGVLRDNMDFSTSIAGPEGDVVAQGLTLPMHLGSVRTALAAVLARYESDVGEDDVFVLNDPFEGGMHLPDIFMFKPVFVDGERAGFACCTAHQTDIGGRVPGSNAADSTEIYQEGLRIPPMKLQEGGVPNATLWRMIERNVRVPVQVFGDLRAQLAACAIGEREIRAQVARYGLDAARAMMREMLDYTERMTRAALRPLPDGEYDFEDWIDDDGVDFGQPVRLFVTVRKSGERIAFDWTGSSPQVRGAINATLSVTRATSFTAIRSILPSDIPNNDGTFRVVEVSAPVGSIANMELPGACAARGLTGFRMLDCAFGALAKMAPDRVCAASDGGNVGVSVGGYRADRTPFIYVDFTCGTWGGRPFSDGLEGNSNILANMAAQSVEVSEHENPVEILGNELVTDACGAGRFRGGAPFYREYRMREEEAVVQVRSDRQAHRPYGLYGGRPGAPGEVVLNPGREARALPSKVTMTCRRGDVVRWVLPGGGGWGDPLERDPRRVLRDVRNELVSPAAAERDYGVIVDTERWQVDEVATERLREQRQLRRIGDEASPVRKHGILVHHGSAREAIDIGEFIRAEREARIRRVTDEAE